MKYIKSLDGVRAIAILLVMLFHFNGILEVGWIGVQLFFVLSGYLITSILLEAKGQSDSLGRFLKVFYWRRTLRIFPLYYLYLLIIYFASLFFNRPENYSELLPYLLSYTYNYYPVKNGFTFDFFFTHFWSLCVEEQFYLLWPFVIYFLDLRSIRFLLLGIIVAAPVFRLLAGNMLLLNYESSIEVGEIVYRLLPSQIDSLAFGAMIPVFAISGKSLPFKRLFLWFLFIVLIIGFVNLQSIRTHSSSGFTSFGFPIAEMANYAHVWSYSLIALLSMLFVLAVITASPTSAMNRILSSPIFVQIGKVSYGMYLYHLILIPIFKGAFGEYIQWGLIQFILYTLVTYIISLASYQLFELRFIKLKNLVSFDERK